MSSPDVSYLPEIVNVEKCIETYTHLLQYPFKRPELIIGGRTFKPLRKTCSYADYNVSYIYSGCQDTPLPWTSELLELKTIVEQVSNCQYNHVLLNLYEDGRAKISPHKDDESFLDPATSIATLSFGASRTMTFSRKGYKSVPIVLESGSILLMHSQHWFHSILPEPCITEGRISLTFRKIVPCVGDPSKSTDPDTPTHPDTSTCPDVPNCLDIPTCPDMPTSPASPLKRVLDEWDHEYDIKPFKRVYSPWIEPHTSSNHPSPVMSSNVSSNHLSTTFCESETSKTLKPCMDPETSLTRFVNDFEKSLVHPICDETLPEKDWLTRYVQNYDIDLKKFPLGDDVFLSIQLYKDELCIHIRQYFRNCSQNLRPSKVGVCMNLTTLLDMCTKLFKITLGHASQSVIMNNTLLALVQDHTIQFRQINEVMLHPQKIQLSKQQFENLKSYISETEEYIFEYLFSNRLQDFICDTSAYDHSMEKHFNDLKIICDENLAEQINAHFICNGCAFDYHTLKFHECDSLTNREKYLQVSDSIRLLYNIDEIAENYLSSHPKLSNQMPFRQLYKIPFHVRK